MSEDKPSPCDPILQLTSESPVLFRIRRYVKGQQKWGGTGAYKYGMTIGIVGHCVDCCCTPDEMNECDVPAVGVASIRSDLGADDKWLRLASLLESDHLDQVHDGSDSTRSTWRPPPEFRLHID